MVTRLKIDVVSDVSCPWCAIGLASLEQALARLAPEVQAELHVQPFELNPQMPPGGEDTVEHLGRKYGSTAAQQAQVRETIRQRGADVGFTFNPAGRGRIYNTFDAHRLLHWAGLQGSTQQLALKKALLADCHTRGEAMDEHPVLLRAAEAAGLDAQAARAVLASPQYAAEVREREAFYTGQGIHSVPAVIINDRHLISGGQPVEVFEQALRQIAAKV
jgi:predicted DsbA family dithiol-disulfide isomerase